MKITMGEGTYGSIKGKGHGSVSVGKYCSIASNVTALLLPGHRVDWVTTYPFPVLWNLGIPGHPTSPEDITVGNDVWIGRGTILLEGARIGDGAVIGAYSVVAGTIAPYAVAVGNPAREISRRFPDETIRALLDVAWWNWPRKRIEDYVSLLCSDDMEEFIRRAREGIDSDSSVE